MPGGREPGRRPTVGVAVVGRVRGMVKVRDYGAHVGRRYFAGRVVRQQRQHVLERHAMPQRVLCGVSKPACRATASADDTRNAPMSDSPTIPNAASAALARSTPALMFASTTLGGGGTGSGSDGSRSR